MFSVNEYAEQVMGRRREGVAIDLPYELGYQCPVCKVSGETLHWSEYNSFLWCETCDYDYPSALCVPLTGIPYDVGPHVNHGRDAAVRVFLDSVASALRFHVNEAKAVGSPVPRSDGTDGSWAGD